MLLEIDSKSSLPIYQQIHDQIVSGIAQGQLESGESLPSVRSLASDIGVNLHTVNKAYALLRDEGYVDMRGRSGSVIAEPLKHASSDAAKAEQSKMEEAIFKAALAYRARGGTRGGFLECAEYQAARAFGVICADPSSSSVEGLANDSQKLDHENQSTGSLGMKGCGQPC